jgi:DNA repair exonuclease SbcCD nuclease subunit
MVLRFIHTADWQLGKPFGNFAADLAGELSAARLDCVARIAAIARGHGSGLVLVAGDTFDSETLPVLTLRRALERLAAESDVRWLIIPGNHDPARIGGLWERLARIGLPDNVVALTATEPYVLAADVMLLPAPLTSRNPGSDPTAWMASAVTPEGMARIGLAHGSVQGFGSEGESSVSIARDRAESAGLAYLALGDWHGARSISPSTWYSGTPEPDRFPDNEPGFVLAVSVAGPDRVEVARVSSAHFSWAKAAATVRSIDDLAAVERRLTELGARGVVRLALTGSLSLADHGRLDAWQETWTSRVRYLEIDRSTLAVTPQAADFQALGADGPLAEAARELSRIAADDRHPDQHAASLALLRLYGFAAQAQREGLA